MTNQLRIYSVIINIIPTEIKSRHHHGTQSHDQRTSLESQSNDAYKLVIVS